MEILQITWERERAIFDISTHYRDQYVPFATYRRVRYEKNGHAPMILLRMHSFSFSILCSRQIHSCRALYAPKLLIPARAWLPLPDAPLTGAAPQARLAPAPAPLT
eukprot:38155-Pleurochrysis_carterae.AAC.1